MALLRGQDVNVGIASEVTRGTHVAPASFIPGRSPSGLQLMLEKALIQETRPNGMNSQGSTIVQRRAEGDLEFNLYNGTGALLYYSLLGDVTTTELEAGSVYQHAITLLQNNPLFPSLSFTVSDEAFSQAYGYAGGMVSAIELRTPVDDLVNATATLMAAGEEEVSDPSVSFATDEYYFKHYDVTIKIADNIAGLAAADAISVKEFSLNMTNNARLNQNIGAQQVIAGLLGVEGNLVFDKEDETYHDLFSAGSSRALRITMTRSDVTIGTADNPSVEIDLANVTFEGRTEDRPLDDIVTESIDFVAHDHTSDTPVTVTFVNEIATL